MVIQEILEKQMIGKWERIFREGRDGHEEFLWKLGKRIWVSRLLYMGSQVLQPTEFFVRGLETVPTISTYQLEVLYV